MGRSARSGLRNTNQANFALRMGERKHNTIDFVQILVPVLEISSTKIQILPYVPNKTPLSCWLNQGGSINPAGFVDKDGTRYAIFELNSNSISHGGDCNNSITPLMPTPILLQRVRDVGCTLIRDDIPVLDGDDSGGHLVEAPNLILHGDIYFLFYSTHCFMKIEHDVHWATSKSITGPYVKSGQKLFKSGDYALTSPGGGTVYGCGDKMLFHGICEPNRRCTYAANIAIDGDQVIDMKRKRSATRISSPHSTFDSPDSCLALIVKIRVAGIINYPEELKPRHFFLAIIPHIVNDIPLPVVHIQRHWRRLPLSHGPTIQAWSVRHFHIKIGKRCCMWPLVSVSLNAPSF